MENKGNISIHAQNIMPVIKRWLYSDKDIFIREMVSNGCDAITKFKMLNADTEEDLRVTVTVDKEAGELRFTDNGIGMTAEEVEKYINQVAFSSAEEFLKNYTGDDKGGIIGHFGLGFYSAFMAADKVTIDTLSYQDGATPVLWESEDGMSFTMRDGGRTERGTTIILHITDEEKEFLDGYRVREVLNRYCGYMSVPIYLQDLTKDETKKDPDEPTGTEEEEKKKEETPINDVHPLWLKNPKDCTEEEYKETYRKLFHTFEEPLFWMHLNVDYPFNLKGILYFPRIKRDFGGQEGEIKLFNRQVFVADNIKEVIPEFLMTMKGVIDCPDLPLNVSRSALQNDGTVKKICDYISKKVADKLSGMCKTQREEYEKYWDDIAPFIKYGCIRDVKFADKMMDYMLFKDLDGKYLTLKEYVEANLPDAAEETPAEGEEQKADVVDTATGESITDDEETKEPEKHTVFYVTDEVQQAQYIGMFKKNGKDAVILKQNIDSPFITQLEQRNEKLKFARIDSEVAEEFVSGEEVSEEDVKSLTETFRTNLSNEKLNVKVQNMKDDDIAAIMTLAEQDRRMQDMMKMYGMGGDMSMFGAEQETLVLNANHPLVQFILNEKDSESTPVICRQLYDLAVLSHKPLTQDEMAAFVKRSNEIMMLLTK